MALPPVSNREVAFDIITSPMRRNPFRATKRCIITPGELPTLYSLSERCFEELLCSYQEHAFPPINVMGVVLLRWISNDLVAIRRRGVVSIAASRSALFLVVYRILYCIWKVEMASNTRWPCEIKQLLLCRWPSTLHPSSSSADLPQLLVYLVCNRVLSCITWWRCLIGEHFFLH